MVHCADGKPDKFKAKIFYCIGVVIVVA